MKKLSHALDSALFSLGSALLGAVAVFSFFTIVSSGSAIWNIYLAPGSQNQLVQTQVAYATAGTADLHGFAWSGYNSPNGKSDTSCPGTPPNNPCSGLGWISFNSADVGGTTYKVSYDTTNWEVNYSENPFSGYAAYGWDSANPDPTKGGWINFHPTDFSTNTSCGGATPFACDPAYIAGNSGGSYPRQVSGWVQACSVFASGCSGALKPASDLGGWDGWIYLGPAGSNPGVQLQADFTLTGYAWGEGTNSPVGWISFNPTGDKTHDVTADAPLSSPHILAVAGVTCSSDPACPGAIAGAGTSGNPYLIPVGVNTTFQLSRNSLSGVCVDPHNSPPATFHFGVDWYTIDSIVDTPWTSDLNCTNSTTAPYGQINKTFPSVTPGITPVVIQFLTEENGTLNRSGWNQYYIRVVPKPPTGHFTSFSTGYSLPDDHTAVVVAGGSVSNITFSWTSTDATSCTITRNGTLLTGIGTSGTNQIDNPPYPPNTATYVLTCTGPGGTSVPDTKIININNTCWDKVDNDSSGIGVGFCDYTSSSCPTTSPYNNPPGTQTGDPGCMSPAANTYPSEQNRASCGNGTCDSKAGETPFTCSVDCRQSFQEQ